MIVLEFQQLMVNNQVVIDVVQNDSQCDVVTITGVRHCVKKAQEEVQHKIFALTEFTAPQVTFSSHRYTFDEKSITNCVVSNL